MDINIKEINRLAKYLSDEAGRFESFTGPAGRLGASPRDRHYINVGLEYARTLISLGERIQIELKKGL